MARSFPGDLDVNEIVSIAGHLPRRTFPDRLQAMSLLNMPGMLGEMVTSLPTTWPESWFPASADFADLWTWRALSWAIYTLPLWWLAGRAFDALRVRNRLPAPQVRLSEMVTLTAIGVFTLLIGVSMFFAADMREDDDAISRWVLVPGLMWFVFGLCSLLAWRRQRRLRRALAQAQV